MKKMGKSLLSAAIAITILISTSCDTPVRSPETAEEGPTLTVGKEINISSPNLTIKRYGNYLFVPSSRGIEMISIIKPESAKIVKTISQQASFIEVYGGFLYIAYDGSIYIYNAYHPNYISNINTFTSQDFEFGADMVSDERYLYTEGTINAYKGEQSLVAIRVSDATYPVIYGKYSIPSSIRNLQIKDKYLYGSSDFNGVSIFDISSPNILSLSGQIFPGEFVITSNIGGDYFCIISYNRGEIWLFDISNPAAPKAISKINGYGGYYLPSPYIEGNYLFISAKHSTTNEERLDMFDISDPENPRRIASIDKSLETFLVYNNYIWGISSNNKLVGIRIDM